MTAPAPDVWPNPMRWRGIVGVLNRPDRQRVIIPHPPVDRYTAIVIPRPLPLLFYPSVNSPEFLADSAPRRCGVVTGVWIEPDPDGLQQIHAMGVAGGRAGAAMRAGGFLSCGLDYKSASITESTDDAGRRTRTRNGWTITGLTAWPAEDGPSLSDSVQIWHDPEP